MRGDNTLKELYREYLLGVSLSDLRLLGRQQGVHAASQLRKEELIDAIANVLTGAAEPSPRNSRGAPPKRGYLDPEIVATLNDIRQKYEKNAAYRERTGKLTVFSDDEANFTPFDMPIYSGILEIMPSGYGFIRARNCQPSGDDVFVPTQAIHGYRLREGDFVACTAKPSQKNDSAAFDRLMSVNNLVVGDYEKRRSFDSLTAEFPTSNFHLSRYNSTPATRVIDLFSPIGRGQRALIVAPPKAGKTTLLKDIAKSISMSEDGTCLIVLLIDERPEEVTDFRRCVENATIISSTFDEEAEHHVRAAHLTLEHAKRLVELGHDVVILLDSLTKLTRSYNALTENTGKTLTGGLDIGAFAEPKRFFGAARNTIEGGSLTILSTVLVETGSRMDDVIYEEFKGTGNSDIFLSRDLAERRIFPAIDVRRSGTRKENLLLSKSELAAVYKMRERGLCDNVSGILEMLSKTENNEEFVARLPDWIKIYKNNN